MRLFYFLLFALISATSFAQLKDTANSKTPETWKSFFPGIRLGLGFQKSFYYEAGLSLQRYFYDARHGFMATCYYVSYERTNAARPIKGIKAGAELVNNGGSGGIEIKYLSNSIEEDIVITPKLGLGIGAVTLFYGYNLSTNKYPLRNLGKHQFSLSINTNILFYHFKHKD